MNAGLGLAESRRAEVLRLQIQRTGGAGYGEINTRFAAGKPCVRAKRHTYQAVLFERLGKAT